MPPQLGSASALAAKAATAPATGGLSLALPLVTGLISGLSSLFGGESDKEKAIKDILDKLYSYEDYAKSLPFSKEELFNQIYPIIKQLNIGAADVTAGRLGSELGEAGATVGGGQNFADLYMQSLAPVIAKGRENAAASLQELTQLYAAMDDASKKRLISLLGMGGQLTEGLPTLSDFQSFILNSLQGFGIGADVYGALSGANYLIKKKF